MRQKNLTRTFSFSLLLMTATGLTGCGTEETGAAFGPNLDENSSPFDHVLIGGEDGTGGYLLHDFTVSPEGKVTRYRRVHNVDRGWVLGCRYEGEGSYLFVSNGESDETPLYRITGHDEVLSDVPPVGLFNDIRFSGCAISADGRYLFEKRSGDENKLLVRTLDGSAKGEKIFEEGFLGRLIDLGDDRLLIEHTIPALSNGGEITWLREVAIEEESGDEGGPVINVVSEGDGRDRSCFLPGATTHFEINRYLPYAVALVSGNFLVLPLEDGFPRRKPNGSCEVLETPKRYHAGRFTRFDFFGRGSRILATGEDGEISLFSFNKAGGVIDYVGKPANPDGTDFEYFEPRTDSDLAVAFTSQNGETVQPWLVRLGEDAAVEPLTRLPVTSDGLVRFYRGASSEE